MIKVSVLYPSDRGSRFDRDYYLNRHIPMVRKRLGSSLKGISVDFGLDGKDPGSRPPFLAMGHLLFDSLDDFEAAFGANLETFKKDVPNYTDIEPTVQISEVKL